MQVGEGLLPFTWGAGAESGGRLLVVGCSDSPRGGPALCFSPCLYRIPGLGSLVRTQKEPIVRISAPRRPGVTRK